MKTSKITGGARHPLKVRQKFQIDRYPNEALLGDQQTSTRTTRGNNRKSGNKKVSHVNLALPDAKIKRSNIVIEPRLSNQWYVKTSEMAKKANKEVKDGNIKFHPENWVKTYFNWMDNIEDWCISRQLWWGHRIPAWYDEE